MVTPHFSRFSTPVARYRKVCNWCGARCHVGITIRSANRNGSELIRGFCCFDCAAKIGAAAVQFQRSDAS